MDSIYLRNKFFIEDEIPSVSYFSLPFPEILTRKELISLKDSYRDDAQNYFVTLSMNEIINKTSFTLFDVSSYKKYLNENEIIGYPYRSAELHNLYILYDLQKFYKEHNFNKQSPVFSLKSTETINKEIVREDILKMQTQTITTARNERKKSIKKIFYQSDDFIFLNPGEQKIFSYNLTPFEILGGRYTFLINDLVKKTSDEDKLPKYINGYKLIKDVITSNMITIDF
ncbi:hypothetical protein [Psychroflexus tropicus]|uniref:hypothetical protein n=1 Tax=Psychroflexus tropicus TaxID=197345 RepID=UPI0012F98663|nr:hypothetical protein [Psychroflexus tropicus]